ncbi:hypothetical protein BU23DRAFT_253517 [Bimuria novae-zelandiae CBS 107.79]|uniref:Uncharacterized protein n=1 Tax=Bimuria novae-zelandiae CBS 107.79 TaxID=1447943 RepID=A0A6A5VMV8_9PLEO|nr:hypothetical protein BU23DRAFT_253517 [Bimuria novae-zelandiae CBS 107.79]
MKPDTDPSEVAATRAWSSAICLCVRSFSGNVFSVFTRRHGSRIRANWRDVVLVLSPSTYQGHGRPLHQGAEPRRLSDRSTILDRFATPRLAAGQSRAHFHAIC